MVGGKNDQAKKHLWLSVLMILYLWMSILFLLILLCSSNSYNNNRLSCYFDKMIQSQALFISHNKGCTAVNSKTPTNQQLEWITFHPILFSVSVSHVIKKLTSFQQLKAHNTLVFVISLLISGMTRHSWFTKKKKWNASLQPCSI